MFFNEAAGGMLGRRFEETGEAQRGGVDRHLRAVRREGQAIPYHELPLTVALRGNRPAHAVFHIRSATGTDHDVEASALPIVGDGGFHGAIVVFWPVGEEPTG